MKLVSFIVIAAGVWLLVTMPLAFQTLTADSTVFPMWFGFVGTMAYYVLNIAIAVALFSVGFFVVFRWGENHRSIAPSQLAQVDDKIREVGNG